MLGRGKLQEDSNTAPGACPHGKISIPPPPVNGSSPTPPMQMRSTRTMVSMRLFGSTGEPDGRGERNVANAMLI
ncbi:hypothetical protein RND71_039580 [Anisodus tanguticus]|uniref:Uncharacterized protein n=1 Tax=Anisodus tanguticus TaxID=243964 RepID=A0AAE1UXQ9_9SOLA|nr:hypothetical protein RND71_039580 [Anisodus tanguticus]